MCVCVLTNMFRTNADARAFLAPFAGLPKDVWVQILTKYTQLSVSDIERMCRVNASFAELCKDKDIWRRVLDNEINPNQPVYDLLQELFPNAPKAQVIANRILKTPRLQENRRAYFFADKTKILFVKDEVSGFLRKGEALQIVDDQEDAFIKNLSVNTEIFRVANLSRTDQLRVVLKYIRLKMRQGVAYNKCDEALCNNLMCAQIARYQCKTHTYCSRACAQQDYFFRY